MLSLNLGPMGPDAPAREPQMVAIGSTVALTFGAGTGIYFSSSSDSGKTFSTPVGVAQADNVLLTHHRGPRIAFTNHAIVITAVMSRNAEDGDLIAWRSTDGGKTWSKGVLINDVPGASMEGLHSLAADGKETLFAAWLDKRSRHGTKLYGAHSADGGLTWSKNVMIYQSPEGTICECCHPSVAIDAAGQILVMWRNWLAGSRDMYLARSGDGVTFSKPEKMGMGTWQLNACPMDGGGLAISQNRVVTAWRREHEIFLAAPGEKEVGIGEGMDVAIAAAPEGVYAVWSTPAGIRALLPGKKESISLSPKGTFPNIVALSTGHALAAWEDAGGIQIQPVQ
ncbi:MAG: sialidase family protein [Bryobacteraceae bacterium]